ncbi:hypothetical protein HPB51_020220 [Rhipicephalus microplus]|uniref:TFA2 Winged helix domain-containing protein n=1 Tax=Rhipicephalus microplus TaxID=6941 RepID=A0A9J6DNY5_RHIMP|nr:hypothetical protein HPB51_020220 [Rhipicephalus microplus]
MKRNGFSLLRRTGICEKFPEEYDEKLHSFKDSSVFPSAFNGVEALQNNPKLQVTHDGKYCFRPAYNLKDRKSLLRLLDKHDQRGLGGVLLEDVQESLPNVERHLKVLGDSVIYVMRPIDKKKVLFYNDKSLQFSVDEG